jgi:CDP-6-deoxy-D-xylo-4-hexulose-3-dehydrase
MPKKVWYAPNKFESYGEEEIKAVEACLRDGWLAGFGDRTVEFEKRVADLFGKKHGLFVNSGSSAILLGLCALDLPKGFGGCYTCVWVCNNCSTSHTTGSQTHFL